LTACQLRRSLKPSLFGEPAPTHRLTTAVRDSRYCCQKEVTMKRIVALILISLLVAPPASADQSPPKPITWEKAQKLTAGKEILLTITGGQPTTVRFLFADNATLVTRKAGTPPLARNIEQTLLQVGPKWRSVLDGYPVTVDRVRVSRDGIFDGARRVADLGDVIQETPRADVLSIADPSPHRHSNALRNFLIGLAALIAASVLIVAIADRGD
jgi:hypothetical protein